MSEICFECGSDENIHHHHVVPKIKGGTKTIPLCQLCHAKVHGDHMLRMQRLAWIRRKQKGKELLDKGLKTNWGRPVGTKEDTHKFLSKPKNKEIVEYLENKFTIKKIMEITGASNKTIIKIKKILHSKEK